MADELPFTRGLGRGYAPITSELSAMLVGGAISRLSAVIPPQRPPGIEGREYIQAASCVAMSRILPQRPWMV
ncbi:MAG: hypothetical protein Q7J15_09130 [Candidatus Desulfaltia sp.]|nr:hypothetical protein [Candidatus Desulfaltia sp.]